MLDYDLSVAFSCFLSQCPSPCFWSVPTSKSLRCSQPNFTKPWNSQKLQTCSIRPCGTFSSSPQRLLLLLPRPRRGGGRPGWGSERWRSGRRFRRQKLVTGFGWVGGFAVHLFGRLAVRGFEMSPRGALTLFFEICSWVEWCRGVREQMHILLGRIHGYYNLIGFQLGFQAILQRALQGAA